MLQFANHYVYNIQMKVLVFAGDGCTGCRVSFFYPMPDDGVESSVSWVGLMVADLCREYVH